MNQPTEAQLNDPKWWESVPDAYVAIAAFFINDKVWSVEYMENPQQAVAGPCNATCRVFYRPKPQPTDAKPESQEWNGEGLPPVGCECEYDPSVNSWTPAKCIAIGHDRHEPHAVIQTTNRLYLVDDVARLRPLRTKEQRERDEAVRNAAHVIEMKSGSPSKLYIKYCETLYDAGLLRKGEQ